MNQDSIAANLHKAQQEQEQAQTAALQKLLQTLKSDLQTSLLAESKTFRNAIAASITKLKRLLWAVSLTTILSVIVTSSLILVAVQSVRKMNDQAQLLLESQRASEAMRELNLIPVGDVTNSPDGRMLIEVKHLPE